MLASHTASGNAGSQAHEGERPGTLIWNAAYAASRPVSRLAIHSASFGACAICVDRPGCMPMLAATSATSAVAASAHASVRSSGEARGRTGFASLASWSISKSVSFMAQVLPVQRALQ